MNIMRKHPDYQQHLDNIKKGAAISKKQSDKLAACFYGWCPPLDPQSRQDEAILKTLEHVVDEVCSAFGLSTDFRVACGVKEVL
jgi:hypothetical protein